MAAVFSGNTSPQSCWHRFESSARKVFSSWTLLCLAVDHGWGGRGSREKADTFVSEILCIFQDRYKKEVSVDPEELADLLADRIDVLFSAEAEDESDMEVATILCDLFRLCMAGDFSLADQLEQTTRSAEKNVCATPHDDSSTSSEDEDMANDDEAVPSLVSAPLQKCAVPDADGWLTVPSRKR